MKAALLKEEEDQLLPHKRKRKPKDVDNNEDDNGDIEPQQKISKTDHNIDKIKKRPTQPPPLNFQELLKIAEKKQYEPIVIEKPQKEESLPMMTKKEKEKYLEDKRIDAMRIARQQGKRVSPNHKFKEIKSIEKAQKSIVSCSSTKVDINAEEKLKKNSSVWSKDFKINKELNNNNSNNNSKNDKYIPRSLNGNNSTEMKSNNIGNRSTPKSSYEKHSSNEKINQNHERYSPKPKLINDKYMHKSKNSVDDKYSTKSKSIQKNDRYVSKSSSSSTERYSPKPKSSMPLNKNSSKPTAIETYASKPKSSTSEKYLPKFKNVPKEKSSSSTEQYIPSSIVKHSDEKYMPKSVATQNIKSKSNNSKDQYVPSHIDKSKRLQSSNDIKPKSFPPKDTAPKKFPPRDMVPKQFPPRDMMPKQFPPPDMRKRDNRQTSIRNKRRVIESDSDEYDSELDDFIDDGPEDEADYSKVISEIFRYDKSK